MIRNVYGIVGLDHANDANEAKCTKEVIVFRLTQFNTISPGLLFNPSFFNHKLDISIFNPFFFSSQNFLTKNYSTLDYRIFNPLELKSLDMKCLATIEKLMIERYTGSLAPAVLSRAVFTRAHFQNSPNIQIVGILCTNYFPCVIFMYFGHAQLVHVDFSQPKKMHQLKCLDS